jgi:hypothetical protein
MNRTPGREVVARAAERSRLVGDHLRSTFQRVIDAMPPNARSISTMSRWLDIHKATCQRVVEALNKSTDALDALTRFPGVEGMRKHLAACLQRGIDPVKLQAAHEAVNEYEALLDELDLSQRALVELVRAEGPSLARQPRVVRLQRKALFEAASTLTGERVRHKMLVGFLRPSQRDPNSLSVCLVSHLSGFERRPFSRPIVVALYGGWWGRFGVREDWSDAPAPDTEIDRPARVIEEFTSVEVRAIRLETSHLRTLLLVDTVEMPEPADVAVEIKTSAARNPLSGASPRTDMAARISQPCEKLTIAVFLHESLANASSPSIACVSLAAPPGDSPDGAPSLVWFERFPEEPELRVVGHGDAAVASSVRTPPESLLSWFARTRLDRPSDYILHRCDVDFPVWQSEYRMNFEFHAHDESK